MSDCNVCVDYGYCEFEMSEVWLTSYPRSRKVRKCVECCREIPIGVTYQRIKSLYDGRWEALTTCAVCAEIRGAFSCGGELIGNFWCDFEENFDQLNTACFDKLQTVEAKKYLRQCWMEWKGLK